MLQTVESRKKDMKHSGEKDKSNFPIQFILYVFFVCYYEKMLFPQWFCQISNLVLLDAVDTGIFTVTVHCDTSLQQYKVVTILHGIAVQKKMCIFIFGDF